jgi:hypothetical protein
VVWTVIVIVIVTIFRMVFCAILLLFNNTLWCSSDKTGSIGDFAALLAPEWSTLLSRVGDELMLALLLHGAVFAPLPGGNYVQLAGTPVHTVRQVLSSHYCFSCYFCCCNMLS